MKNLRAGATAAFLLCLTLVGAPPATALSIAAACPAGATCIYSGDGDTLRAIFYENINWTGARLMYYGSSPCTATLSDADFSKSVMPTGWNDRVSSIRDYASCDIKLYTNTNFGGPSTAWINAGSTPGYNLPASWNDQASSFRVS
jgi:hypothetical protein